MCDNQSGYSSARCNNAERCSGSYNGYCNPNNVWSSDVSGSSAYNYNLNGGAWYGPNLNSMSNAFSVRCGFRIDFHVIFKPYGEDEIFNFLPFSFGVGCDCGVYGGFWNWIATLTLAMTGCRIEC